jgi:Protein of unknown function (DUF3017)
VRGGLLVSVRDLLAALPRWTALAVVLLIAVVAFERILTQHWRQGATLLGAAMLVAAVARAVLPEDRIGVLAVRGRVVDVIFYAAFGIVLIALALTITGGLLVPG